MNALRKLDNPPAAENWSRMQYPEVQRTAKKLLSFLKSSISWNYSISRKCAQYYVEDGISREQAIKIVETKGSAIGRPFNREVVDAWFDMVDAEPIQGVRAFDQLVEWFPLGRGISVPIRPLTVIRQSGRFAPIFFNPWSKIAFSSYQASLYMSVLEHSLFRLTDFEDSQGKIIFLPSVKDEYGQTNRKPLIWERGQFQLLSQKELNEQVRIFSESRMLAKRWYQEYLETRLN